jgi:hypothetical protein
MSALPLLDWTPTPRGETFSQERDGARLGAQYLRVRAVMLDMQWHTLREIAAATGDPEASVSARIRQLKDEGFTYKREFVARGLWRYRIIPEGETPCATSSFSGSAS